jgi:multidrug resistance efflux pump
VRIVSAQLAQARAQLDLARQQLARTRLEAPFDGIVVTGNLSQQLGAPVERGDVLFEVAPLDDYRVVVQVDESDIDELAVGQAASVVLTAFPDEPLTLVVEQVTPVSEAAEGKNTFRVEARLEESHERLRPGMEGVAKVEIGPRRLIWIWTHGAFDWLRLTLWNWMP